MPVGGPLDCPRLDAVVRALLASGNEIVDDRMVKHGRTVRLRREIDPAVVAAVGDPHVSFRDDVLACCSWEEVYGAEAERRGWALYHAERRARRRAKVTAFLQRIKL